MRLLGALAVLVWLGGVANASASDSGAAGFSAQGFGQPPAAAPIARGAAGAPGDASSAGGSGGGARGGGGGGFDGAATRGGGGFDVQVAASSTRPLQPPASK